MNKEMSIYTPNILFFFYIAVLNAEIDYLKTKEVVSETTKDHIHITIITLQQRVKELKKDRVDND